MSGAALKLVRGDRPWAGDLNPWLRAFSGLGEGMLKVRGGGDELSHLTGAVLSSNNYQAQFQSTAGKHLAVRLAATGASLAPTSANSVLLVDDAFVGIGDGKALRVYETGGTDYAEVTSSNGSFLLGGSGALAGSMVLTGDLSVRDLTATRDLILSGTGPRIKGDFSNATHTSRVQIQTSTVNGNTSVGALPNGTGTFGGFTAYGGSNPAAAAFIQLAAVGGTDVRITSSHAGAAYLPLKFFQAGAEVGSIDASGYWTIAPVGGRVAFYGQTPVARQAVPAAAIDAATNLALTNALRVVLINLGLAV